MEAIEGKSENSDQPLPPISALDKIIVAFAGPLFSFLLALAFAWVVMLVGRPVSEAEMTTTVGYVEKDGPADKAGLRVGDRILEVDGQPVSKFGGMGDSVTWRIVRSEGEVEPVKVARVENGLTNVLTLKTTPAKDETKFWERKSLRQIKIGPAQSSIIAKVVTNSPAAFAGLQPGDQVLEFNGKKMEAPADLQRAVGLSSPTQDAKIKVLRDQGEKTLDIRIGEAPEERVEARGNGTRGRSLLGLDVRPVTPEIARQLNLPAPEGVVVARVEDGSAAAEAGVQRGDVVREINRQRVRTLADFERLTKDSKEGDRLTVLLQRGPMSLYVAFTVGRG